MPAILFLLLVRAGVCAPCPEDRSVTALRQVNQELLTALDNMGDLSSGLPDRAARQLACTREPPMNMAARTFLLLGAWYFYQGEGPARADRYFQAAFALEGMSVWDDALGPELASWYQEVGTPIENRGVVFTVASLFDVPVDLWGSSGEAPWIMPVGTFTFEVGERSVPVSVNTNVLTVVTPDTVEEFFRAPELIEQPVSQESIVPGENDEIEEPTPPIYPIGFHRSPSMGLHLSLGGCALFAGASEGSGDAGVPTESMGLYGGRFRVGLLFDVRERWTLLPEAGVTWAVHRPDFLRENLHTADYEGQSPIEEAWDHWMGRELRLTLGHRWSVITVAAGPGLTWGRARVSESMACEESATASGNETCYATATGEMTLAGLHTRLTAHPPGLPVLPQLDLSLMSEGERLYFSTTLSAAWEKRP